MNSITAARVIACFAAVLAIFLLTATLAWHIPFMLWDHLELAPMYQGWVAGHLDQTTFWKLQGTGHWHIAAYALLLPSAWLTNGHPWLDCILSWAFLCTFAGILLYWLRHTLPMRSVGDLSIALIITFLILYPGHFFNLQMGWQLAVFECLLGAAVTIAALSANHLSWQLNLLALAGTALGVLSFAVSYAMFGVALVMIAMRTEMKWRQRIFYAVPWFALALTVYYFGHAADDVLVHFRALGVAKYTLYYLGSGIARFAPLFAPWIAAAALIILPWILRNVRDRRAAMPWFALLLFALGGAVLTSVGRGFLGPAEVGALAPRYVSFSVIFWIGWLGLLARARADGARWHAERWAAAIGLLAAINAAQLTYEAKLLGRDSRGTAQTICRQWPNLDKSFLDGLIYSGPDAARGYLQNLHDLGFAPFDACPSQAMVAP
jgi:hypothetical protein